MLQVTRSGTTGRLDRLAELGLVDREVHPDDARSALVTITADGAALAVELMRAALEVEAVAFAGLTGEDRTLVTAALRAALIELDDADSTSRP